jgi:hypothetical protein
MSAETGTTTRSRWSSAALTSRGWLFHAESLRGLDAGYAQRREEAGGERDDAKDNGNGKERKGVVIADSIELAAENACGDKREGEPGREAARGGEDA